MGITIKLLKIAIIASMTAKTDLEFDETIVKKHLTLSAVNFKELGSRFIKSSTLLKSFKLKFNSKQGTTIYQPLVDGKNETAKR